MLLILNEPVVNATLVELNIIPIVPMTGDVLTILGLGAIGEVGSIFPEYLNEVNVDTASIDYCMERYLTLGLNNVNDTIMFCAGTNTGGKCIAKNEFCSEDGVER